VILLIHYLQVASNPEIDLGDDDDPDKVEIMLRVMYDDDGVYALNRNFNDPNLTKTLLDYYLLGDKYDVPVIRQQAKEFFISELGSVYLQLPEGHRDCDFFDDIAKCIAMVLGPSACTFGDKSIQEETLQWCAESLNGLLWHRIFRKMLSKGHMFSAEFAGRLLLARLEEVEFGWDRDDNDVYEDSSSDEHITQAESESGPDIEEDDGDDDDEEEDDDEESSDSDSTQVRGYEPEEGLGS
jgi:hypothetical protein